MASRGASLFAFFFCNEKKKGGFGAPPQELLHKPKGGAKGLKFGKWYALLNRPYHQLLNKKAAKGGKMWPLKRKQGEKCYFSPCALISKLTNSRYQ